MSYITQLAPPTITTLNLEYADLEEREWRDFFRAHLEVRSINCTGSYDGVSRSLWDALSPAEEGNAPILCPRLETVYITLFKGISFTPLADCLRNRRNSGFKLGHLKVMEWERLVDVDTEGLRLPEVFSPLVESFESNIRSRSGQWMSSVRSPVRIYEPGVY